MRSSRYRRPSDCRLAVTFVGVAQATSPSPAGSECAVRRSDLRGGRGRHGSLQSLSSAMVRITDSTAPGFAVRSIASRRADFKHQGSVIR